MLLSELVADVADQPALLDARIVGGDPEIRGLTHDSRQVAPGFLFCAIPGHHTDGHRHASAAVAAGASALLVERSLDLGVAEVLVGSARAATGPLASSVNGHPSRHLAVVGVTGTNGKTTTVALLASILDHAGRSCEVVGTLTGARTTPEAPELQARLAAARAAGRRAAAVEVSSHALDLHRVDGTRFEVAIFTNLSRDHLDHHGDMGSYFAAKARLFEPDLARRAVVCTDDPHGRLLLDAARIPSVGYALADAEDLELSEAGARFHWRGAEVALGLAGRFNVANALAAATAAAELGVMPDQVAAGLAAAGPVPGRFERVDVGQDFLATVDYAHTPDGLENVLVTARELAREGRVIVVFGAGGDRDQSKRSEMGEVAARLADVVILTNDNARSEDPAAIIDEVQRGMESPRDLRIEPDRRAAIALAVGAARRGDVVVVAGKGHETTQIIGDRTVGFDDRVELARVLEAAQRGEVAS